MTLARLLLGLVLTVAGAVTLAVGLTAPLPVPARVTAAGAGLAGLAWSLRIATAP